jgi:hypothetical protein
VTTADPFTADVCPACKPKRDAMSMARAEDHRSCARLTARVKELEAEVARWRTETRAPPLPIAGCTCHACEVLRRHQMEARRFAEGTRDEKAARCAGCLVPVDDGLIVCAACRRAEAPGL